MNTIHIENIEIIRKLDAGMDALFFDSYFFMKVKIIEIIKLSNEVVGMSLEVCSDFFGAIINNSKIHYFTYQEDQRRDFKVSGVLVMNEITKTRLTLQNLNIHLIFEEDLISKFDKKKLRFEEMMSSNDRNPY